MFKFIGNVIFLLSSIIVLEYVSYSKDYNEVLIMDSYLKEDIKKDNIESFSNDKYEVIVSENEYKIIYKRESLFNLKFLKNIHYSGIIE